ncbi:MAG: hypothetical protein M1840_007928 [Geoglossum simile]|nr:MAG: hypothetical protein M1840_007928 [Geoglossum simile]
MAMQSPNSDSLRGQRHQSRGARGNSEQFSIVQWPTAASGGYDESRVSSAFEHLPRERSPNGRGDSNTSHEYGVLWELLWLCPDISELTTSLVQELKDRWNYNTAFLLVTILDLQTTYQRYLESSSTSYGPAPLSESALLTPDIVLWVVSTCAGPLILYATHGPDDSLGRDLQSRVIAMALSLFKHLGARDLSREKVAEVRSDLLERDSEAETDHAASPGDGQLLIRYSLSFLLKIPNDEGVSFEYVRAISSLFFVAGLIYTYNVHQALKCLQVMSESPQKTHPWHYSFHELQCITLGAISLSRFALIVHTHRDSTKCVSVSDSLAQGLIERIEPMLRTEVERLAKPRGLIRRGRGAVSIMAHRMVEREDRVAHALLYLVGLLADEFGGRVFFERAGEICKRLIRRSWESRGDLKELRFKAYEILLAIERKSGRAVKLNHNDLSIPDSLDTETSTAQERFRKKVSLETSALRAAIRRVQGHRGQLPEVAREYGLFREDWPGLGPELGPDDPRQGSRIQRVQGQVVHSGRMLLGRGLELLRGPFGNTHQSEPLHELDSGQHQQSWLSSPASRPSITETDLFSPATHSQEFLSHPPHTPTSSQPQYTTTNTPSFYQFQFPRDPSHTDDRYLRRDSIASNPRPPTRSGPGSNLGGSQRTSSVASGATANSRWQEPPVALSITRIDAGRPRKLEIRGSANAVVLAPDCRFAGFMFDREIRVASIDTQGGGRSGAAVQVLKADKKAGPFACAAISSTLIVGITHDTQIQLKQHSTPASGIPLSPDTRAPGFRPTCAALSIDSRLLAVGFRPTMDSNTPNPVSIVKVYAILDEGREVHDMATLKLPVESRGEPKEELKVVSFWVEGNGVSGVICGGNKRVFAWKSEGGVWDEDVLVVDRTLPVPGPGGKYITSVTPFVRSTLHNPYYITTAILSGLPRAASTTLSPLSGSIPASFHTPYPENPTSPEHLYRSATSPDGLLAAFLTKRGVVRIATLQQRGSGSGRGLKMEVQREDAGNVGPEESWNRAASLGVVGGGGDLKVIAVTRDGKVLVTKVGGVIRDGVGVIREQEEWEGGPCELENRGPVELANAGPALAELQDTA